MYNKDRKICFIEDASRNPVYSASIFNRFEPVEEEMGVDLCELDVETVQHMLDTDFGYKTSAIKNTIKMLKDYNKWCVSKGYKTSGSLMNLEVNIVDKMRSVMVSSPAHLEMILDRAFPPVESESVDCVYRCYIWMAFSGMSHEEALSASVKDVNFDLMTIERNGKSYVLFRESIPAFRMACSATKFKYYNKNYSEEYNMNYRDRFDGDAIVRGIRSPSITYGTITAILSRKFQAIGVDLSYNKVLLSGVFYKAYETERCGYPADFSSYIDLRLSNMKDGMKNVRASVIKYDIMRDYECWKKAFSV